MKIKQRLIFTTAWLPTPLTAGLRLMLSATAVLASAGVLFGAAPAEAGTEANFNDGWRFWKGNPGGAEQAALDDSSWQSVRLPHDWAIAGPFQRELNGQFGKVAWQGVAWYRKHFRLPEEARGKRVYLDFDGVMAAPKVYVNGKLAGQCDYGYMSFRIDATPFIHGGDNVIAVSTDTTAHGTRWYPGGGIYRKVSLVICHPVHVSQWGTQITTPKITDQEAEIRIRTSVDVNLPPGKNKVTLESVIFAPDGSEVARLKDEAAIQGGSYYVFEQSTNLKTFARWSLEHPALYSVRSQLYVDGKLCDRYDSLFGIRTIQWTADDGFHLNGKRVQLNGVNLHHDHGPLGAAFYRRAMERQIEILKDMGCNAIRTSHNVQSPELLELCDRMGMLVYNEAFDKWRGNGPRSDRDLVMKTLLDFVRRDRNHPSVICWSIGNEIPPIEMNEVGNAPELVQLFTGLVRQMDPTRPVTQGCFIAAGLTKGIHPYLDFNDFHYNRLYAQAKLAFPKRPSVYSESASAISTRGFYRLPLPKNKKDYAIPQLQIDSYDLNAAPWADIPDVEFQRLREDNYCAGEFVWTGFDYLGEPTPYDSGLVREGKISMSQTARSSYFGIVDLVGIPKDRYYLYRSHWAPEKTTIHILPHWNWADRVGQPVPVFVYTNGDEAELFLNGRSLGRRRKASEPAALNLAKGKAVAASSEEAKNGNLANCATDGNQRTRWCAAKAGGGEWWQVDLGKSAAIRSCRLDFETPAGRYRYVLKASDDARQWHTVVEKNNWTGNPIEVTPGTIIDQSFITHEVNATARYWRLEFTGIQNGGWASLREFAVYAGNFDLDPYYAAIDMYRLRWMDVAYQPGELKAVAYKDGKRLGEQVMRTAGAPAKIRLTPDHATLAAGGEDLSYILVEAVDQNGNLCPLADPSIQFKITGPAEIAGVGNGNPQSIEPFQANSVKLFYGKAMLIIRSIPGKIGNIRVIAAGDGLPEEETLLQCKTTM